MELERQVTHNLDNNIYTHNINECRICWTTCNTKSPCNCNNLVHLNCLKVWIKSKTENRYYCETCNQFYRNISIFSFINTIILLGFNTLIFYITDIIWENIYSDNGSNHILNIFWYIIICFLLIFGINYLLLKYFKHHSKYVRYMKLKVHI